MTRDGDEAHLEDDEDVTDHLMLLVPVHVIEGEFKRAVFQLLSGHLWGSDTLRDRPIHKHTNTHTHTHTHTHTDTREHDIRIS